MSTITGNNADNTLVGGNGGDTIDGLGGNDQLFGLPGGDRILGGNGDDTGVGDAGGDTLDGQAGNDLMFGEADADRLIGGEGDDQLQGGDGADVVLGGNDNDTLIGGNAGDTIDGGAGRDFVDYFFSTAGVLIDLRLPGLQGGGGEGLGDSLTGIEDIAGTNLGDTLDGDAAANALIGRDGDDRMAGHDGADSLLGGNGADLAEGGNGNDTLVGDAGGDTLGGADGDDFVVAGNGNDLLDGGAGSDTLSGGNGGDTLIGGPAEPLAFTTQGNQASAAEILGHGADLARFESYYAGIYFNRDLFDEAGLAYPPQSWDYADYFLSPAGEQIDLSLLTPQINGDLLIRINAIFGSGFGDTLSGDGGDNLFIALGGNNILTGAGGNDIATWDDLAAAAQILTEESGASTLSSGASTNLLFGIDHLGGTPFGDFFQGNSHRNFLIGGGGGDTLLGQGGADILHGGLGPNLLGGGDGDDILLVGPDAETLDGGAGDGDALDFRYSLKSSFTWNDGTVTDEDDVTFTLQAFEQAWSSARGNTIDFSQSPTPWSFFGRDGNDAFHGTGGGDCFFGGGGTNTLFGNGGDDSFRFGLGDDTGFGGAGRDTWQLDDRWSFNLGAKLLDVDGGADRDTFEFRSGGVADNGLEYGLRVELGPSGAQNFASGPQLIAAAGLIDIGDGAITGTIVAVEDVIGSALADTVVGNEVGNAIEGGNGGDSLDGGDGSDSIAGDAGDDTLAGGAGFNLVDGGEGADLLALGGARAAYRAGQTEGGLILLRVSGPLEYHLVSTVETIAFADETVAATVPGTETVIGIDGLVVPTTGGLDFLIGGPLNDSMAGGGGDDVLLGLDGDDVVTGDEGNDLIADAGTGNDSLTGGAGFDVIFGFDGADTINTGVEGDFVQAGGGADLVIGGDGIDSLFGEEGDDWILGGNDLDFVIGGPGADALDAGDGNDRVHVSVDDLLAYGGAGIFDVLVPEEVSGGFGAFDLGSGDNQNVSGAGPLVLGFEAIDATIATGAVHVTGGSTEGRGNVLIGSFFDDTLTGSDAADIIIAGPGEDAIDVSAGNDTATGGGDADVFIYANGTGAGLVTITDFAEGDRISTEIDGLSPEEIAALFEQEGADAVLLLAPGRGIVLTGVSVAALGAEDFIVP